jgi:oligoribonuclease
MHNAADHLVWMDLEMSGLDPNLNRIIEIATIITNNNLDIIAEGPVLAIHQSHEHMNIMDAWNVSHHGASGLTERVRNSTITEQDAQKQTLDFIKQYVKPGESPLCGNTIYQDRRFLYNYMPELEAYFHYRLLDVSTLKILAERWAPKIASSFVKESRHEALYDIRDSIEELRYYRQFLFNSPDTTG